jgi:hypothetical protein
MAMMELGAKATTVKEPWSHMFLSNPPCKTVDYELDWESCIEGPGNVMFTVHGRFRCEEGIAFASLINEALGRRGKAKTSHVNPESCHYTRIVSCEKDDRGDTTLLEQITAFKAQDSKRVVRLKTETSNIKFVSASAPTAEEFDYMDTLGLVLVSVLR